MPRKNRRLARDGISDELYEQMLEWQSEHQATDLATALQFKVDVALYSAKKEQNSAARKAREEDHAAKVATYNKAVQAIADHVAEVSSSICTNRLELYVAFPSWESRGSLFGGLSLVWYVGRPVDTQVKDAHDRWARPVVAFRNGVTDSHLIFTSEEEALDWADALNQRRMYRRYGTSGGPSAFTVPTGLDDWVREMCKDLGHPGGWF